jgi:hypothetical protein
VAAPDKIAVCINETCEFVTEPDGQTIYTWVKGEPVEG